MPGMRPNKKELAQYKALKDLGHSPTAIARRMGRSHHTVISYLNSDVYNDPEIQELIDVIKEKEINDLYLLGAKARKRLHDLLDEGTTKAIETTAVMDRSFQQRRLLEGQSTQIVDYHDVTSKMSALDIEIEKLQRELGIDDDIIDITPDRKPQPQEIKPDGN